MLAAMSTTRRDGTVLVLELDDGENRLTSGALAVWEEALEQAADPDVTALVTTGAGKFYSNGLEISEITDPYLDRVVTLLARLLTLPVVTVAAVNGHAFGAGAMLLLAHDARVMRADRGYVCLPEVDLGMPFPPLMSALVRGKLPPASAQEAMTFGLRYPGPAAQAAGFVGGTAAEHEVLPAALALAADRGGKNRDALGVIKTDLYADVLALLPDRA